MLTMPGNIFKKTKPPPMPSPYGESENISVANTTMSSSTGDIRIGSHDLTNFKDMGQVEEGMDRGWEGGTRSSDRGTGGRHQNDYIAQNGRVKAAATGTISHVNLTVSVS